jgi:hypothetical protein
MPGPIFWIITVLVAVLFCTGHFCAGLWVGRELFGRRVIRQAREALTVTVAEVDAQESAAESLLQQSEKLAASARQQKSPAAIAADVAALQQAASALRDAMRVGKEHCREALAQLPEDKTSKTDATSEKVARVTRGKSEPGIEVEEELNPEKAPAVAPEVAPAENVAVTDEFGAPVLPALSPEELERFRTGFPTRQNSERADTRYPYGVMQYVAPVVGNSFPDASEFQHVKCRDVSRRGVSYFSPEPPSTEQAILTLGGAPNLSFVCVRITNHRETVLDGETGYTIGCEFVARLAPGIYCWDATTNSIATAAGEMVLEGCA